MILAKKKTYFNINISNDKLNINCTVNYIITWIEHRCMEPLTSLDPLMFDPLLHGPNTRSVLDLEYGRHSHLVTGDPIGCDGVIKGWEFIPGMR